MIWKAVRNKRTIKRSKDDFRNFIVIVINATSENIPGELSWTQAYSSAQRRRAGSIVITFFLEYCGHQIDYAYVSLLGMKEEMT